MKQHSLAFQPVDDQPLMVLPPPYSGRNGSADASTEKGLGAEGARRIHQSIEYMMQHLNRPLQISKLAQVAHISSSHFFVLFKRWSGFSPIEYFIRLRMQRAGQLLVTTTMSVKEVAATLGYDDPFYFSRVFKTVHGMAPTNYRAMAEEMKLSACHADTLGSDHKMLLAPLPDSAIPDNNADNENPNHEKHSILHST